MKTPLIAEVLDNTLSITDRSKDTTCIECGKFGMDSGCSNWSDMTPGDNFSMRCGENAWYFRAFGSESEFSTCLRTAATCGKFERRNRDDR